jgi:hypothetical protein
MVLLACKISNGLRPSEVTVEVQDYLGRSQFLPADRDYIHKEGSKYWLPVYIVQVKKEEGLYVVGLPVETDSGSHRIQVKADQLKDIAEAVK